MAHVEIDGEHLWVKLDFMEKLAAVHGSIRAHLLQVDDAHADLTQLPEIAHTEDFHGTYLPGAMVAGSVDLPDGRGEFFQVSDPSRALTIELHDGHFKRITVEVDDESPEMTCARILSAASGLRKRWSQPPPAE